MKDMSLRFGSQCSWRAKLEGNRGKSLQKTENLIFFLTPERGKISGKDNYEAQFCAFFGLLCQIRPA